MPSPVRSDLSRRRFLGLGAGLGAAALLGGCGDDGAAPVARAAASTSATALEPYTVRTCVYAKNHASSALYWQQFAPEGIQVEVVPVKSAIEVQDGLESGHLDFGLLAPYTPIIALAQDPASISS